MNGINYLENFLSDPQELFDKLEKNVVWDERMSARKTASFGNSYNYSQIEYPFQDFLPELRSLIDELKPILGFEPNNCLINYYLDGKSKMGFHSDQTDILVEDTGIAIVSLGATRELRFKNIKDSELVLSYDLPSGSLIYMTQEIQKEWKHAIPKSKTENGRMSLTFRKIK